MDTKIYKLKFSMEAAKDLDDLYEYISVTLSATKAATDLMFEIERKISILKEQPFMGTKCEDSPMFELGFRKLIVKNYIVIYSVVKQLKIVNIVRIFYGGQDYARYIR
jgi:toxin ParE1/3/4